MKDPAISFPLGKAPPAEITAMAERRKELEAEMDDIKKKIEVEYSALLQVQQELEAYAISDAPIKDVSDETLLYIFLEYLNTDYVQSCLITLSNVCRRWHKLVIESPQLWSRIQLIPWPTIKRTESQLQYIKLAMERNQALPLDIEILFAQEDKPIDYIHNIVTQFGRKLFPNVADTEWETSFHPKDSPIYQQFGQVYFELISELVGAKGKNMKRWKSAHITLSFEPYKRLWSLFAGGTPNLVTLKVEGPPGPFHTFSPRKMASFPRLPSLRELCIPRNVYLSSVNANPKTIHNLTTYEGDGWLNFRRLRSFPELRSLCYTGHSQISPAEPKMGRNERIQLPYLESLELYLTIPPILLQYFDTPRLSQLSLSGELQRVAKFPDTPMLASPKHIALEGDHQKHSNSHLTRFFETFLPQCKSIVSLTIPKDLEEVVFAYIESNQKTESFAKLFPNLQNIYRGADRFYEESSSILIWDASTGRIESTESK